MKLTWSVKTAYLIMFSYCLLCQAPHVSIFLQLFDVRNQHINLVLRCCPARTETLRITFVFKIILLRKLLLLLLRQNNKLLVGKALHRKRNTLVLKRFLNLHRKRIGALRSLKYSPLSSIVANCSPISQPFASTAPFCFM